MEHTPGPWRALITVAERPPNHRDTPMVVAVNGIIVADVWDTDRRIANARLIAAAPDLLAALKDVAIPSLKYCEEKYGHDNMARLNLEAAIAKTEKGRLR